MRIMIQGEDITLLGFSAATINATPQAFPIVGALNCPKRKDKTYHLWGAVVEPYVLPEDMVFEKRSFTLMLSHLHKKQPFEEARKQLYALMHDPFTIGYGSYEQEVICTNVAIEKRGAKWHQLTVALTEKSALQYAHMGGNGGIQLGNNSLDGVGFAELGLINVSTSGQNNLTALSLYELTDPSQFRGNRAPKSIALTGTLRADSVDDLVVKSGLINGILMNDGERLLAVNGKRYDCFCVEGATYQNVKEFNGRYYSDFSTNLIIVREESL